MKIEEGEKELIEIKQDHETTIKKIHVDYNK